MSAVLEVTDQNWDAEVLQSELPVLVDFWATWCGPCRALAPTVDAVAQDLAGQVKVVKLDVGGPGGAVATRYNVTMIPVLMLFKGGKVATEILGGNLKKPQLLEKLQPYL